MRAGLIALSFSGLLVGCAGVSAEPAAGSASAAAAERGRAIAQRACASCHGLGVRADSRRAAAPPFRDMRLRYNEIMFQRRMTEIAEGGHYEMPPVRLEPGEIRDVAAYIESLGPN